MIERGIDRETAEDMANTIKNGRECAGKRDQHQNLQTKEF